MQARSRVYAAFRQSQALYSTASDEVLPHDVLHICRLHESVPHGFRIHNDDGPVLALIQAAGAVYSHAVPETCRFDG